MCPSSVNPSPPHPSERAGFLALCFTTSLQSSLTRTHGPVLRGPGAVRVGDGSGSDSGCAGDCHLKGGRAGGGKSPPDRDSRRRRQTRPLYFPRAGDTPRPPPPPLPPAPRDGGGRAGGRAAHRRAGHARPARCCPAMLCLRAHTHARAHTRTHAVPPPPEPPRGACPHDAPPAGGRRLAGLPPSRCKPVDPAASSDSECRAGDGLPAGSPGPGPPGALPATARSSTGAARASRCTQRLGAACRAWAARGRADCRTRTTVQQRGWARVRERLEARPAGLCLSEAGHESAAGGLGHRAGPEPWLL